MQWFTRGSMQWFWRWAHDRAEALCHWIYYNRLPEGRDFKRQASANAAQGNCYYNIELQNAKGEPVTVPSITLEPDRTIRPGGLGSGDIRRHSPDSPFEATSAPLID